MYQYETQVSTAFVKVLSATNCGHAMCDDRTTSSPGTALCDDGPW